MLLQDGNRPWTDSNTGRYDYESQGKAFVTRTITARIPGGQDPVEGQYVDTVTATVQF
jgi:spore coat protein U-like protein